MKLSPSLSLSLFAPVLACLAQAESGKLYIYDSNHAEASGLTSGLNHHQETSVSPETARLILASRLSLDQYHDLGSLSDESIDAINRFAASSNGDIFARSSDASSVALLLGQDVDTEDILADSRSSNVQVLNINDVPSWKASSDLLTHLSQQSRLGDASAGSTFEIAQSQREFLETLDTLTRQDYTVLALSVPKAASSSKSTYGKYDTSRAASNLRKRTQFKEAPLITESPAEKPSSKPTTPSADTSKFTPLQGILPQCFSSKSACEKTTRNCTGHGSCTLKYTDKDARPEAACYSCSCSATVRTNKDGSKKTTNWGGPACQKKDIVMPFWLLAGFSVIMVSLISWAIGLLMTMGNEELPSVIGAGVSGVPRSK
ncbi:hypothetical protein AAFC00_001726 [Neodothiora populina]|uniref:DUF3844 domain-containing protein n=1 Tax=Neodothiora populina TaxID=2781224 RepID=A0ABR3PPX9_9PEZI